MALNEPRKGTGEFVHACSRYIPNSLASIMISEQYILEQKSTTRINSIVIIFWVNITSIEGLLIELSGGIILLNYLVAAFKLQNLIIYR